MKIQITRGTTIHDKSVNPGEVYEVDESAAVSLIRSGLAEVAKPAPPAPATTGVKDSEPKKGKAK